MRKKHARIWYNIDRYYTAPSEASVHREAHTMCKAHGIISTDIIPRRFASDQRENKLSVKMRSHIQSLEQEILILKQ